MRAFWWFVIAVLTVASLAYAPAALAQEPVVGGVEGKIIAFLNGLVPLVTALNGLGLIQKYAPIKMLGYMKDKLIPVFGTLLTFLVAFGGDAQVANAGVFSGLGGLLSNTGKLVVSYGVTLLASGVYEQFLRPAFEGIGIRPNRELLGR